MRTLFFQWKPLRSRFVFHCYCISDFKKKIEGNAAALRMANAWKAKLQKKAQEESDPLKTPINITETESKVRHLDSAYHILDTYFQEQERDEEEPFWLRLTKAIFFSVFGTVVVLS